MRLRHLSFLFTFLTGAVIASPALVARQAAPPPIPPAVGTAAGTLRLGSTSVALAHAYASGPIQMGGALYQVVLTDQPVPAPSLARELARGGQALLKAGKLNGVALLVDETGRINNIVPFVGELRGSKMLASAGTVAQFELKGARLAGQIAFSQDRTMDQGWSAAASWTAAVVAPK